MNHHGRVRKLGREDDEEDTNNDEETGAKVLMNNWVGRSDQLQLGLISRQEDVQVVK